jgi:DNA-binding response OmpR family regulator
MIIRFAGGENVKIRVLVVDDDEDLLFLARKFLKKADASFELAEALTDQEALRKIEEEEFDAIVCDHYLGEDHMTGLDLLEWVRNEHPQLPFIILTGRSEESVAIRALNLGADYYLKKGSDEIRDLFDQIAGKIRESVQNRREEEEQEMKQLELERLVEERTKELSHANQLLHLEIEERKRAEDYLVLQRELGNTLCKTESLDEALEGILRAVVHLEGVDAGGIYLVDSSRTSIDVSSSHGISGQFIHSLFPEGVADLKEAHYFSKEELLQNSSWKEEKYEASSVAVVPVVFEDKTVAILAFASHTSDEIPEREQNTLEAIAVQIGAYMARIRATEAIAESQEEILNVFSSLNDIFFITSLDWKISFANMRAMEILGRSQEELKNLDVLALYNVDIPALETAATAIVQDGGLFEIDAELKNRSGQVTRTNTRIVKGKHNGDEALFVFSREIS